MSKKLCNCGTCGTAADRALKIVEKSVMDDECPIFINGIAAALASLSMSIVARQMVGEGFPKILASIECHQIHEEITSLVNEELAASEGVYGSALGEIITKLAERKKEEAKLPKGD